MPRSGRPARHSRRWPSTWAPTRAATWSRSCHRNWARGCTRSARRRASTSTSSSGGSPNASRPTRNRRHVGTVRSETPDSEELAEAQRATEAVLETLAERIAPGDVEDLIARLPIPMHAALKRGMAQADDVSRRMPADEFVARVARRAGIDVEQARGYAHAVLSTLRELVPEEFFDVTVQLPDEYWVRLEID